MIFLVKQFTNRVLRYFTAFKNTAMVAAVAPPRPVLPNAKCTAPCCLSVLVFLFFSFCTHCRLPSKTRNQNPLRGTCPASQCWRVWARATRRTPRSRPGRRLIEKTQRQTWLIRWFCVRSRESCEGQMNAPSMSSLWMMTSSSTSLGM